jgi:hypothetical protein
MISHAARLIDTTTGMRMSERLDPSMPGTSFRDHRGPAARAGRLGSQVAQAGQERLPTLCVLAVLRVGWAHASTLAAAGSRR